MHKRVLHFGWLIIVCSMLGVPQLRAQESTRGNEITSLLESIRQKHKLPALAGAIVSSKGLINIGSVGVRKAGTRVSVTPRDQWHLGSDTKAMTATLIGGLVEKKRLSWTTTVGQVFPELLPKFPVNFRRITLLELLSHHSGLPANLDWRSLSRAGSPRDQRISAVKIASMTALLSEPGVKFEYSNLGYVIAGAMAETVANESWEDLISRRVFKPLGMRSAGFGGTGTPGKIDQPWGHDATGAPVSGNGPMMDNPEVMGPAGTIHCSLQDWAHFIADQLRGDRGAPGLLKPATYKDLHTPPFGGDYALGWGVTQREWGGGRVLTHAGSNTMNYAVVWMAPERDFAVLVVTNQGGPIAEKGCDEAAAALIGLHQKNLKSRADKRSERFKTVR